MTGDQLHSYTRKHLAAIARRQHVPGWHDMRKADLIEAIEAEERRREEAARSTRAAYLDDPRDSDPDRPAWSPDEIRDGEPIVLEERPRRPMRHLLRAVDRGRDRFYATAVTPYWIRSEWKVSKATLQRVETSLGAGRHKSQAVLRLYDVSSDDRLTHTITLVSDTPIPSDVHEWFVKVDQPGGVYQIELGILGEDGKFHRLGRSGRIHMGESRERPISAISHRPPVEVLRSRHRSRQPITEYVHPLSIEVALHIRGVTDPQANVAVADETVAVEDDGSFEHSLLLTDGRHVIPTIAVSKDGRVTRTSVVAIEKNTKNLEPQRPGDY